MYVGRLSFSIKVATEAGGFLHPDKSVLMLGLTSELGATCRPAGYMELLLRSIELHCFGHSIVPLDMAAKYRGERSKFIRPWRILGMWYLTTSFYNHLLSNSRKHVFAKADRRFGNHRQPRWLCHQDLPRASAVQDPWIDSQHFQRQSESAHRSRRRDGRSRS